MLTPFQKQMKTEFEKMKKSLIQDVKKKYPLFKNFDFKNATIKQLIELKNNSGK